MPKESKLKEAREALAKSNTGRAVELILEFIESVTGQRPTPEPSKPPQPPVQPPAA